MQQPRVIGELLIQLSILLDGPLLVRPEPVLEDLDAEQRLAAVALELFDVVITVLLCPLEVCLRLAQCGRLLVQSGLDDVRALQKPGVNATKMRR